MKEMVYKKVSLILTFYKILVASLKKASHNLN